MPEFDHKGFFAMLERQLPPGDSLPKWLSTHLNLSESGAYRKINGNRGLQLDELLLICAQLPEAALYAVELFPKQNLKVIQLQQFHNQCTFKAYLSNILHLFTEATKADDFRFRYVARDLPLFYFLSNPLTLQYKYNQWLGNKQTETLDTETLALANKLWKLYLSFPSEEIWLNNAFAAQYQQLFYEHETDFLKPHEGEMLKASLELLFEQNRKWRIQNKKDDSGQLKAYVCNALHLNNGALLHSRGKSIYLGSISGAFYFHSGNPGLIEYFNQQWQRHIIWSSIPQTRPNLYMENESI